MTWSQQTALERIERHRRNVPEGSFTVQDYSGFLESRRQTLDAARKLGLSNEPIWRVGANRAVTTHGVHVYANLVAFNDVLVEAGRETEASHERALQFLHLHYSASDALIAAFDVQRVDFHGGRVHAVVLTPTGPEGEATRIEKALAFAAAFVQMTARAASRYGEVFRTDVRIGVDSGAAVAINSGSRGEPDPLFIGSPANHAAHLAAGEEPGIYVSPRVERARRLGDPYAMSGVFRIGEERLHDALDGAFSGSTGAWSGRNRLDEAFTRFVEDRDALARAAGGLRPASFVFHYRAPPLRTLDYADHPPSRTVRLPVVSIFADLAGFTRYVDHAILSGQVAQAVANLYVIRSELADVLQSDFDGRKVRFIGDCLHGLIAEGDSRSTDEGRSVRSAVLAAGGLRSSFELCRRILPGLETLEGIAIGLELGTTPICRLGLSGDASVRCSTSKATCLSEALQSDCSGRETAIGERAFRDGDARVRHLFGDARRVAGLTFQSASALLSGVAAPAIARSPERLEAHDPA